MSQVITAESLRLASMAAQTEVQRLALLAAQSAEALAAAEQRANRAEAEVRRLKALQKKLKTAPAELVTAAAALLERLDTITTEEFQCGEEHDQREALREVLETIQEGATENER